MTHAPAFAMLGLLLYDYNNWKLLTPYSGYFSLGFLVLILSLNPIKKLNPQWIWILKLNRYRRQLGIACFSYALLHLICFLIKRISKGFLEGLGYFLHPAIIPAFWVAFPIFLILALTSNHYSMKKLSFPRWKALHKTVYIAQFSVFIHMVLVGQMEWALICFLPLCTLQFLRKRKESKLR